MSSVSTTYGDSRGKLNMQLTVIDNARISLYAMAVARHNSWWEGYQLFHIV